ncbi:uncharacterized protein [Elaeis guineensis]|uniref:uncharacterized protein n=1 Tax=Elaeis guineensis var. tenera TaxID=51953 RepID=UPI003C6DB314
MGNVFARKKIFKWSIRGFSSIENNIKSGYYSGYFEAKGYRWRLKLVVSSEDKTSYLRLGLCLDVSSLPPPVTLKVDYKLGIYDELHGNHKWEKGKNYFAPGYTCWSLSMMPIKTFKSRANGFLINDDCFLSAEVTNASPVVRHIGASECSFVPKQMISYSNRWTIRNFSTIQKPISSEVFEAGRLKWHLALEKTVDFIVLCLKLDQYTIKPPNSAENVKFALHVMDQVEGNHKNLLSGQHAFSSKINSVGWQKVLHLEDLQNPSNGFLVNDTCIIVASVTVLGLSTYHDVLLSHYDPF